MDAPKDRSKALNEHYVVRFCPKSKHELPPCPTAVGQWDSRYLPGRVLCARESLQLHKSFRGGQIGFRDGSCELSDFKRLVCECI
jgi:hypothetical protein